MNKNFYNIMVFSIMLCFIFCSCRSELINNDSDIESRNSTADIVDYYTEHFEDDLAEDYHAQIYLGRIKPFNEGETVKLDDLLPYFCLYQMTVIPTGELVDELKDCPSTGVYMQFKVPKQTVVDMLSKRFEVKIDSENSSYQAENDENSLILMPIYLDADSAFPAVSSKVDITENGDITVIRYDELKKEKVENEGSLNHKVYFSFLRESEIGIRNYGTDNATLVYYRQN